MGSSFVVDASALVKLFMDEPHAPGFRDWRRQRILEGDRLLAPTALPYEVGQLLRREAPLGRREGLLLEAILNMQLEVPDWGPVFTHADKLTFYDAAYLAVATREGATLVTYDRDLLKAARDVKCKVLSPGA